MSETRNINTVNELPDIESASGLESGLVDGAQSDRVAVLKWLSETIKSCPALSEDAKQLIEGIIRMDLSR